MDKRYKRFLKLHNNSKEAPFFKVRTVLNDWKYMINRIKGSHVTFENQNGQYIRFPVHNNKVKKEYVKYITNQLIEQNETLQLPLSYKRSQ